METVLSSCYWKSIRCLFFFSFVSLSAESSVDNDGRLEGFCLFVFVEGVGGGVRVAVFLFVFLLFVFFFRQTQRAREIDQRRNNRCVRAVSFDPRSLSFRLLLSFVRMFTECSNRDGRSRFRIVWLLPACFP